MEPSTESAWIRLRDQDEMSPRARKRISAYCSAVERKSEVAGVARPTGDGPFDVQEVLILQQVLARSFATVQGILVASYAVIMTILFSTVALSAKANLAESESFQIAYGFLIVVSSIWMMIRQRKTLHANRSTEAAAVIMERRLAESAQQELKRYRVEQTRWTGPPNGGKNAVPQNKCSLKSFLLRLLGQ